MAIITRTLRSAARQPGDPLNILLMGATHERTESNLARSGHRFFMLRGRGLKEWDGRFAPLPLNYVEVGGLPPGVPLDLVLSQTRGFQFEAASHFASALGLPHVNLAHTLPPPNFEGQGVAADLNAFISAYSREAWGFADDPTAVVIEHAVDTALFHPGTGYRKPIVIAVANRFAERDAELGYSFFREATEGLPVQIVGDNPGVSEPARSPEDLARVYRNSLIFVNTARRSPVPTTLIEGLASGCACVSTWNPMVGSVIRDGESGYLVDDPAAMRERIVALLDDPGRAETVGLVAAGAAAERFALGRYLGEWDEVFRRADSLAVVGAASWRKTV